MQNTDSAYNAGYMLGKMLGIGIGLALMVAMIVCLVMALRKRTTGWIVAAAVSGLLTVGVIGIAVMAALTGVVSAVAKMDQIDQRVASPDQKYALTVPHSWRAMNEINAKASIATGNGLKEQYLMVISESKDGFTGTLSDYAQTVTENIAAKASNAQSGDLEQVTVNGKNALRRRITGKIEGLDIAYMHTSLETDDQWCQLICWTLAPREKIAFPVFEKVVNTLEVK